jgi:hypothetical protein
VLGLLWVLALYGETEGEYADQLVLDGGLFGSRKECGWLVRKRDTSLHVAVEQAMEIMQKHTISFEFAPSQDGWTLKMNFHQEMGGRRTISALKQYVVGLSKLFGEPVYAGSCRFTGEAFARFSKADMSALVSCPDEFKIVY